MSAKRKKRYIPRSTLNRPEQRPTQTTGEQEPARSSGISTPQTGKHEGEKEEIENQNT